MATGGLASSLFVRLGLDSSEYTAGLTKAEMQAKKLQTQAVAMGVTIGTVVSDAIIKVAYATLAWAEASISLKSHLMDLNIQTGISVEKLDGLRKVGMYSSTSIDEIAMASARLNRSLANSGERTTGAARALKALGLDMKEFQGLKADEQMLKVAEEMARFEDGTGKSNAAMLLFGRTRRVILR